jgi:hypothetical protein
MYNPLVAELSISSQQSVQAPFFNALHGTYMCMYNQQCIRLVVSVHVYVELTQRVNPYIPTANFTTKRRKQIGAPCLRSPSDYIRI